MYIVPEHSFSSFYIGNPKNCNHKKYKNGHVNIKHGKKKTRRKRKKKRKCEGGGGGGHLYFLFLISNTLPQLGPSSLQPPPVLHHRHLLQTTSYNRLLLLLHLICSLENSSRNRLRTVEKSEGPSPLQPTAVLVPNLALRA